MITGTVALAFTAGMVATFNPCGFSLLPAYIGAFVAGDEIDRSADQRVLRAIGVAAAVSIGFIVVFATVGLIIDSIAGAALRQLPWVSIAIGGLLVVAGVATIAGWKPSIALRGPRISATTNSARVMVGYGVTYAIASLSCTLGPFLAITGAATSRSWLEGLATYVAYALGMGVIILLLSVASALAHSTIANHMRRLSRIAPQAGGALMVFAGGYTIWYSRWQLAVYDGEFGKDPIIDTAEATRLWFVDNILRIGSQQLAILVVFSVAAAIAIARSSRPASPPDRRGDGKDAKQQSSPSDGATTHPSAGSPPA